MATNTAGSEARELSFQAVHYLRKSFDYSDDGDVVTMGVIPAGSIILKPISGVHISTVFDAGTTNAMDMGTSGDPNLLGTQLSLLATTFVPLDETVGGYLVTVDTEITLSVTLAGTAATAGAGEAVLCYIPDNDG